MRTKTLRKNSRRVMLTGCDLIPKANANCGSGAVRFRLILTGLLILPVCIGSSFADDKKQPPVSSQPETTTATYGAWTLQCQRRADVANGQKICEIAESVVPQNQQNPIARIGIGRPPGPNKAQLRITAILPPNVYIPTAPTIKAKDDDRGIPLVWQRCFAGGCFADAVMTAEEVRVWRAIEADTGRLTFTGGSGRILAIQFSLRGFSQAMDALDRARS
jgi:invasion protein IalB